MGILKKHEFKVTLSHNFTDFFHPESKYSLLLSFSVKSVFSTPGKHLHEINLFQKMANMKMWSGKEVKIKEWSKTKQWNQKPNNITQKPCLRLKKWNIIPKQDCSSAIWLLSVKDNIYSSHINHLFASVRFHYHSVPWRTKLHIASMSHWWWSFGIVTQGFIDSLLCLYMQTHRNGFLCSWKENTHETLNTEEIFVMLTLQ